jgi:hypothetical protein
MVPTMCMRGSDRRPSKQLAAGTSAPRPRDVRGLGLRCKTRFQTLPAPLAPRGNMRKTPSQLPLSRRIHSLSPWVCDRFRTSQLGHSSSRKTASEDETRKAKYENSKRQKNQRARNIFPGFTRASFLSRSKLGMVNPSGDPRLARSSISLSTHS